MKENTKSYLKEHWPTELVLALFIPAWVIFRYDRFIAFFLFIIIGVAFAVGIFRENKSESRNFNLGILEENKGSEKK